MEKGQEVVNPDVSAYACNYDLCCFVPRSPLPPSTLLRRLPLLVIQEGSNVWLCAVKVIWVDEDIYIYICVCVCVYACMCIY